MVEDRDAAREVIEAVSSNLTNNGQRVLPCQVVGDRVLTRVGDVPYEWRVIIEDRPASVKEVAGFRSLCWICS